MRMAKMYFLAVVTPAHINEQVLKWKHYMRDHYRCTVALRSPAHITLIPPFWMDDALENKLISDLGSFAAQRYGLTIRLKGFDAFKPKVIFVGVEKNEALGELKSALEDHLEKYPIKKDTRPFHPHLTIANRDLMKKDFAPAFAHFSNIEYEVEFPADAISLLKHNGVEWQVITSHKLM